MAIFYSSAAPRAMDEPALKRPRTTGPAVHFKAMQLSWTSLALVGIDNHGKVSGALVQAPPQNCVGPPTGQTVFRLSLPESSTHPTTSAYSALPVLPSWPLCLAPPTLSSRSRPPSSTHPLLPPSSTFLATLPWLLPSLPKNIPSQGAKVSNLESQFGGI